MGERGGSERVPEKERVGEWGESGRGRTVLTVAGARAGRNRGRLERRGGECEEKETIGEEEKRVE